MNGWSQGTVRSVFNIEEPIRFPSCCGSFVIWTQGENPPYDIFFTDFGYPVGSAETKRITTQSRLSIWPNPFRQTTTIKFQAPRTKSQIELKIYDVPGRLIKSFSLPTAYSLVSTTISWDGSDLTDREVPAGIYFCVTEIDQGSIVEKIIKVE